jgi:hypothetical protein
MKILKLMTDYECYPLWDMTPGEYGDIDPNSLPISDSLKDQLLNWADIYDSTLNWQDPATSGFQSVDAAEAFKAEGMRLADQLREELGPEFVVIVNIHASEKTSRT